MPSSFNPQRFSRILIAAGAGAGIAASLLFAAPTQALAASEKTDDYRIGHEQPIDSINPLGQQNVIAGTVSQLSYDLLLNYRTEDGRPDLEHSLAESYKTSPDGKTWTFKLKEGISWSDGKPFTSADVKWTYDAVRTNETNMLSGYLTSVRDVSNPDLRTVRISLSEPDARIDSVFIPILPKHVFAKVPIDKIDKAPVPLPSVTTAPFRIKKWDKSGTTELIPNPSFRGSKPSMNRVLFVHYDDGEAALRDLKLSGLDMVSEGNSRWAGQLKSAKDITVWGAASPGFSEIAFNSCPPKGAGACSGPGKGADVAVVQDSSIRQAIAWGIDREALSRTVYGSQNPPAYGLISPYYSRYFKDHSRDPQIGYRYDPEKARSILRAGGWDCTHTPCTKGGTKARFEMMVRSTEDQDQNAVRRIRAWAADLGITIDMAVVTEDALNNAIYAPGKDEDHYAPTFDAFYWGWSGDIGTPDFNLEVLRTDSTWQDSFYSSLEYDRVSIKALKSQEAAERVTAMHEAEKIAMKDLPYIPTVYSHSLTLTRNDTWHGYLKSPQPNGSPFGTNWLQLTNLQPGPEIPKAAPPDRSTGRFSRTSVVLLAGAAAAIGFAAGRRRKPANSPVRDWTDED
ncbi:ABC transporter substrate-binding protein [Streptomyces sp. NPDC056480]|uniref:ABC transporter substrate-binding protein n=1 Tax=Streptomyces sp. NPDC056480 TaxID=3345833 RepID=UPI00369ED4A5